MCSEPVMASIAGPVGHKFKKTCAVQVNRWTSQCVRRVQVTAEGNRGGCVPIADWPINERPREKLLDKGPTALSDAELVAILFRTGVRGRTAVDLARAALKQCGSLSALLTASRDAFRLTAGLGDAKYVQLQAVLEMSRRALRETLDRGPALSSPQTVRDYLRLKLQGLSHAETFETRSPGE